MNKSKLDYPRGRRLCSFGFSATAFCWPWWHSSAGWFTPCRADPDWT